MPEQQQSAARDVPSEPRPSPWESLAQQTRWLANAAERVAALDAANRIGEAPDELDMLDERALAVRSVAAACRRETYRALRERGWSVSEIAAKVGTHRQAVHRILRGPTERDDSDPAAAGRGGERWG